MKNLNKRAFSVKPSVTIALNNKAHELISQGKEIINFSIGEPYFPAPREAKKAVQRALKENRNRYTPAAGLPELRRLVARKFSTENGIECDSGNVIISNGAKHSIFNALAAIIGQGDEVIIPRPAWFTYAEQLKLLEGVPVYAESGKNFEVKAEAIEEKISGHTKAIIINSPCNPTGGVTRKSELRKIADIALQNDLYVVSDEVYEHFVYDDAKHCSIASLDSEIASRTITINSASKAYAMTGYRIGYLACRKDIAETIESFQSQMTSNAGNLSQYACIGALGSGNAFPKKMAGEFDKGRKLMLKMFSGIPGMDVVRPQGAFYMLPNFENFYRDGIRSSADFSAFLLEKASLMTVPGSEFGAEGCIRFSFALPKAEIRTGMERLAVALALGK